MDEAKGDNAVKSIQPGTNIPQNICDISENNKNIALSAASVDSIIEDKNDKMSTATSQFLLTPSTKTSLTSSTDVASSSSNPYRPCDGSPSKAALSPSQDEQLSAISTAQLIANKKKLLQNENLRRVIDPPKLERKHSSGDLHSRLKTRKILGVGETDNGDIHRSKISQVLGHNEHLYVKFPRGVWNWQAFLSVLFLVQALLILFFPRQACQLKLLGIQQQHSEMEGLMMGSKYYAVSLLALSFILWKFMFIRDKGVARTVQLVALIHFSSLCAIDLVAAVSTEISHLYDVTLLIVMGIRVILALICSIYLNRIGTATSGLRKSPSHKDLVESLKKER